MKPDRAALDLLQQFAVTAPPVDVESVAGAAGAKVAFDELESSVSGMLVRPVDGRPVIIVNDRHPRVRQRFTVAHEIGHLRLHKGRAVIVDHMSRVHVNMRDATSSLATSREEIEANQFAASLLMPDEWVRSEVAKREDLAPSRLVAEMAELFEVSEQATEYRLINLGLRAAP